MRKNIIKIKNYCIFNALAIWPTKSVAHLFWSDSHVGCDWVQLGRL